MASHCDAMIVLGIGLTAFNKDVDMMKITKLKSVLLIALLLGACTSKQQATDDMVVDTDLVDQQLAQLDEYPAQDEVDAGFAEALPSAAESLGEEPFVASEGFDSAPVTEGTDDMFALSEPAPLTEDFSSDSFTSPEPQASDTGLSEDFSSDSSEDIYASSGLDNTEFASPPPETSAPVAAAVDPAIQNLRPLLPLLKIESAPFRRGGALINAVYIGRPGDTFSKIAEKIYGNAGKASDLQAMNPAISKVRVGTKIYYNSPNRPNDESVLKVFYDDIGIAPQVFVAQADERLRPKSDELLGFSDAWKEIWSTNMALQSKTQLPAGSEIYYWPEGVTAAPVLAQTPPPPPAPEPSVYEDEPAMVAEANTDFPPPPPMPEMDLPPPMEEAFTPPPPPPAFEPPAQVASIDEAPADSADDMMMILGAIGILSAGAAGLIVIRKRKQQKDALSAMDSTHISAGS